MSVSRIEIQGQVARAQDFTTIKQNEDNKGMIAQNNIARQASEHVEHQLKHVYKGDDVEAHEKRYDAKDKGNGQYSGDGGKKRHKNKNQKDGTVIVKGYSNFDMKI